MAAFAIKVQNLSKLYRLGSRAPYHRFTELVTHLAAAPFRKLKARARGAASGGPDHVWALRDVSFQIEPGEVVGVIGRNGAGKSTLLKILSRITEPTDGYAQVRGRVGSLLEVGTGFHPELTGRENIFLNGAVLGMNRAEVKRKFDQIVAFAETEDFLDTPVKRYSSGMYMRLAFAVAAHLEPEVLLVDEVLAVGDAAFQKKCLGKMGEVARGGRTVLFVSHNMAAVRALCPRSVWLAHGRVHTMGPTSEVIEQYLRQSQTFKTIDLAARHDRIGTGEARFVAVRLLDGRGEVVDSVTMGQPAAVEATFRSTRTIKTPTVGVLIKDTFGQTLLRGYSHESAAHTPTIEPGERRFVCRFDSLPLMHGHYMISLWLSRPGECIDSIDGAATLHVTPSDVYGTGRHPDAHNGGVCVTPHTWSFDFQ